MTEATLGFLFRDGKIILAKKKRKIGVGKWNGYGGKIEEGEDRIENLIREMREECGVIIEREKCEELGFMEFLSQDSFGSMRVYMYRISDFAGYPVETEEMGAPREFSLSDLPYEEMMDGDDKFMPYVWEGRKFEGQIYFDPKDHQIKKVTINLK